MLSLSRSARGGGGVTGSHCGPVPAVYRFCPGPVLPCTGSAMDWFLGALSVEGRRPGPCQRSARAVSVAPAALGLASQYSLSVSQAAWPLECGQGHSHSLSDPRTGSCPQRPTGDRLLRLSVPQEQPCPLPGPGTLLETVGRTGISDVCVSASVLKIQGHYTQHGN